MTRYEVHARRIEIQVRPGTVPPAKYADGTDRAVERDFSVEAGSCRVCNTPRYRHWWVLFDGDTPIDCSERPPSFRPDTSWPPTAREERP